MAVDQSLDRSALRQLFDACDPSGSGFISKQSLLDGCQRLQLDDLTAENMDVLFAELATDDGARCEQISFEAFVERFAAWATQQNDQLDGGAEQQPAAARRRADAEEEFVGVSDNGESFGAAAAAVSIVVSPLRLGESDLAELVRRFDADTSGVSLRNALVTRWSLHEQRATELTAGLNGHMSEVNIRQVLCESLRALGLDVDVAVPTMTTASGRKPVVVAMDSGEPFEHSPDRLQRSRVAYDRSPAPSPRLNRGTSMRRSVHMSRNVSLEDANIGDLKYDGEVRQLWENMKASQPELLDGFASFLDGVSQQLKDAEREKEQLKTDLDRGTKDLDERAIQLDEEASHQIELAKAKVKAEERNRIQHIREELEKEVRERDTKLETAMDNLNGLQLEVQKLMAKDKSKKSQYEEMEQMKLNLETALDVQKKKHDELEQLLAFSSGQESPTRPQSTTRVSGSEQELMSQHLESLHEANVALKRKIRDQTDELEMSAHFQHSPSFSRSNDGESSYSSDHRSHQAAVASSPSPFSHNSKTRLSASKYTSDEDALSGRLGPQAYSPRARRSGSFRRSLKRPKPPAGSSPRLAHDGAAVRKSSAAAAEFGDDEGSPTHDSPGISAKARPTAGASSDSDSDLQVDEQQALPAPAVGRRRADRQSLTDAEAARQRPVMVVRRTSLSPTDLVPGFSQAPDGDQAATDSGSDSCDAGLTPVVVRRGGGGECVVSTPKTHAESLLAGERLRAIPSSPELFSPPVEIVISENGEVSAAVAAAVTDDVVVASSGEQRVIPLASVPPMREEVASRVPASKPAKGRSMSMRVKTGRPTRRQANSDDPSKTWAAELGDRLDLVSSKPVSMPAVVHPIKAQPPKHSTMQFPITADLVDEVGGITPDRVFKVVFCGDSGVGKTSYIWRICNQDGDFQPGNFSSTIGVDFQTRLFAIEGQQTVLQLWDTAGQERFRTFTKQYFRKADGVIVMYDICNSQSFMNVREWMHQIQEATGDSTAVMLLGNKVDLADMRPKPKRQVTYWQAQQLAQQSNALFAEVSAKSGHYIMETCMELGKILLAAEKDTMDGLLKLDPAGSDKPVTKKKSCCE